MPIPQDNIEKFTSHMIKALSSLTRSQLELMNAQTEASPPTPEIEQAWELLWSNLHSIVSLASVIRISVIDDRMLGRGSPTAAALTTPLVPPESVEFRPLIEAVDASMECADQLSRRTEEAFERLIYTGHGESDCAGTVTMVRLYGRAAKNLLETVKAELEPSRAAVTN